MSILCYVSCYDTYISHVIISYKTECSNFNQRYDPYLNPTKEIAQI